jgi:hypothetical protein
MLQNKQRRVSLMTVIDFLLASDFSQYVQQVSIVNNSFTIQVEAARIESGTKSNNHARDPTMHGWPIEAL